MALVKAGVCVHLLTVGQVRPHLYVVLNDPIGDPPTVCLVNFSGTLKSDKTTILKPTDPDMHPFIVKETHVMYAWAKLVKFDQLEAIVKNDISKRHHKACSPALLERLRKGILESPFTTPEVREFCKAAFAQKPTELKAAKTAPGKPTIKPVKATPAQAKPKRNT